MILPGSYSNGFAPRDGEPLYPELWRGCVGAWSPSLGPSGTVLRDWSGRGKHGSLNSLPGTMWEVRQRNSLYFSGVSQWVEVPTIDINTNAASVSAWVYYLGGDSFPYIVSVENASGVNVLSLIFLGTSDPQQIRFTTRGPVDVNSTVSVAKNVWTHIAGTVSNSEARLYVNGNLSGSSSVASSAIVSSGSCLIGTSKSNLSGREFNGSISEILIHSRDLREREIELLATRPGIAYELAPVRWAGETAASYRRRLQQAQIIGAGTL